jgi:hypothetical protein
LRAIGLSKGGRGGEHRAGDRGDEQLTHGIETFFACRGG